MPHGIFQVQKRVEGSKVIMIELKTHKPDTIQHEKQIQYQRRLSAYRVHNNYFKKNQFLTYKTYFPYCNNLEMLLLY